MFEKDLPPPTHQSEKPPKSQDKLTTPRSTRGPHFSPANILHLQQTVGNRAVQRLLSPNLQRDLDGPYGRYAEAEIEEQQEALNEATLEAYPSDFEQMIATGRTTAYKKMDDFVVYDDIEGTMQADQLPELADATGSQTIAGKKTSHSGHREGWKIHISVMPNQAVALASVILPALRGMENPPMHKLVKSLADYTSDDRLEKRGKFITIYPKNVAHLTQIFAVIEPLLTEGGFANDNIQPPYDLPIGQSNLMSTRYGSFNDKAVYDPAASAERGAPQFAEDTRTEGYKPAWIETPAAITDLVPPPPQVDANPPDIVVEDPGGAQQNAQDLPDPEELLAQQRRRARIAHRRKFTFKPGSDGVLSHPRQDQGEF